jgi:KDO2-lipid IV(A) lauroyltransferase
MPRSETLDATLPDHWGPFQRLKNASIYAFVRGSLALLAYVPFRLVELFTLVLAVVAPYVARTETRRALEHLRVAFPELTEQARRRIMRRMYVHLGRAAAEATHIERFLDGPRALRLTDEQRALLDAAFAEGKGVVAITGHIGNWELLAQVVARAGYPIAAIAKPTYDPRLTRLIDRERSRFGLNVIWRGDTSAARAMLSVFKRKAMLALLIDQDTKVQGDFVPFFGVPAFTPTAPAALALRYGAPVVVAWHHRVGSEHTLHFERLAFSPTGDVDRDELRLTWVMTARLEYAIRQHPEQWVWMHRRWKQKPSSPP